MLVKEHRGCWKVCGKCHAELTDVGRGQMVFLSKWWVTEFKQIISEQGICCPLIINPGKYVRGCLQDKRLNRQVMKIVCFEATA